MDVIVKEPRNTFVFRAVSFFDLKLNPYNNGISDNCILRVNTTEEKLGRCFDEIKNNKYFLTATGWKLIEKRNFRSQIELIMPEEMTKKYYAEKESLGNAIANFYDGSNYWGD